MDKELRNTLRNTVTKCRKLLEEAIGELLQGRFGIHADGTIEGSSRLTHLSPDELRYRDEVLAHLEHIRASGLKPGEATAQLMREAAFTHLNRLCAYKMMAARDLRDDPVGKGLKSRGFMFYLASHPDDEALYRSAKEGVAYRHYLEWLNDQLSSEIGVLFAKDDLATRLFPPHRVLTKVLDEINREDLIGVWAQDEAIGWVYQYFTPKELREESRRKHPAPQNSYELAFRNQFYTPRYVVEFLVDNTLGRLWYEMRKGETSLKEQCSYLIRRSTEIFLPSDQEPQILEGDVSPDLSQEELIEQAVYIKHREKKDPRDIKILDPACGSGHFLLYCFDLLEVIYEDAYRDADLGPTLQSDYLTIDDLKRDVPRLILERNLHGIDIDLRSTQISALALWLRAQRAYRELGIEKSVRTPIRRTNIVCAEPMPGEHELLEEFLKEVYPPFLADVVRVVFDNMKLAGEAGSLLKIEEKIRTVVVEAKKHWRAIPQYQQLALFRNEGLSDGKQRELFDLSGITDAEFWNEAEARVLETLQEYSQRVAVNGKSLQRRLFADDAAQGFAFIDICRKRFDVVLMNPPFGASSVGAKTYIADEYPHTGNNLYSAFHERALSLSADKRTGLICSRTFVTYRDFSKYRQDLLLQSDLRLTAFADLGWEVLDGAQVETAAFVTNCESMNPSDKHALDGPFFRLLDVPTENKRTELLMCTGLKHPERTFMRRKEIFSLLPGSPLAYWSSPNVVRTLATADPLQPEFGYAGLGASPHSFFFRLAWEVPPKSLHDGDWRRICRGGDYSPFYRDNPLVIDWFFDGKRVKDYILEMYPYLNGNYGWKIQDEDRYGLPGLTWGKRNERFNVQIMPAGHIFTDEGQGIVPNQLKDAWFLLGYLNSATAVYYLSLTSGLQKHYVYVRPIPILDFEADARRIIEESAESAYRLKRKWACGAEEESIFVKPWLCPHNQLQSINEALEHVITEHNHDSGSINKLRRLIAHESVVPLSLDSTEQLFVSQQFEELPDDLAFPGFRNLVSVDIRKNCVARLVSYAVGCQFGRWDLRYAVGLKPLPALLDAFAALPACAPGTLTDKDGLPLTEVPHDYPSRVRANGILVNDATHEYDILLRVNEIFQLIWPQAGEMRQREANELLGVKELRDYFRKSGNGGFWMDHVKLYSKSQRKAPIYWYLRSSKGNYAVWLYYHRLDKDMLFKALLNFVEPKLRLEDNNLASLRQRREVVGSIGREGKQLEKDLDKQESFLSELHDFHDKLKRVTDLNLEPDLNDGVVLNIAPLWELVPWKEAEKYWKELISGKYEWSSIGKQLRERGLVQQ